MYLKIYDKPKEQKTKTKIKTKNESININLWKVFRKFVVFCAFYFVSVFTGHCFVAKKKKLIQRRLTIIYDFSENVCNDISTRDFMWSQKRRWKRHQARESNKIGFATNEKLNIKQKNLYFNYNNFLSLFKQNKPFFYKKWAEIVCFFFLLPKLVLWFFTQLVFFPFLFILYIRHKSIGNRCLFLFSLFATNNANSVEFILIATKHT